MPRRARDERLDTRAVRLRLTPRPEPYWRPIQDGHAIGYRRLPGGKAGTWVARRYDPVADKPRVYRSLGSADDMLDADGADTLTFAQAQDRARTWFDELARAGGRVRRPMTVGEAMTAYLADYEARGGRALRDTETAVMAHILPALGERKVSELTERVIKEWHQGLAKAPARLRTAATAKTRRVRAVASDDDAKRARRATANRLLTILKAALNLAYANDRVVGDGAWRRVTAFKKVNAARVRYLDDAEAVRLMRTCSGGFREIVTAALLTGMRYGEIVSMKCADFSSEAGTVSLSTSKTGKPRLIHLTDEGRAFFVNATAGKARDALVFQRNDGMNWRKSHQSRPLREACGRASIAPAIGFHILRHTYASRLVMRGVSISVVAQQLGDSEAITARHYAHLSPNYVAKAVREAFGNLGLTLEANVMPLRRAG